MGLSCKFGSVPPMVSAPAIDPSFSAESLRAKQREKARRVEDYIIMLAQKGKIMGRVNEAKVVELLDQISASAASEPSVSARSPKSAASVSASLRAHVSAA